MRRSHDGEWRLIREETNDGATTMAFDTVAAETAAGGGPRTVRVYQWDPGTLSMGYRQDPDTVDWAFCEQASVDVVRRPTGGGGIYHDTLGDISYSIIAPAEEVPGDLMETYEWFCEPLFDAFEELGVDARFVEQEQPALYDPACYLRALHPAHDIVAGDGRKLSGNAQYRTRDAVVQHGSISFGLDAERHLACFDNPPVTPDQFRERVTSISEQTLNAGGRPEMNSERFGEMDPSEEWREHAVHVLEDALADWAGAAEERWTDTERERAEEIAERKYRSDAWTYERTAPLDR